MTKTTKLFNDKQVRLQLDSNAGQGLYSMFDAADHKFQAAGNNWKVLTPRMKRKVTNCNQQMPAAEWKLWKN